MLREVRGLGTLVPETFTGFPRRPRPRRQNRDPTRAFGATRYVILEMSNPELQRDVAGRRVCA